MPNTHKTHKGYCPIMSIFMQLSKKWILPILLNISSGEQYFSSLKRSLGPISSRTLSLRLKELQENDFIERTIVSEQPLRITYTLTKKGRSFSHELDDLAEWSKNWK